MVTLSRTVYQKYSKALLAGPLLLHQDAAVLALRLALGDLDRVWEDEYAELQRRVAVATEMATENRREVQTLRSRLAQMAMEAEAQRLRADALGAECARLTE